MNDTEIIWVLSFCVVAASLWLLWLLIVYYKIRRIKRQLASMQEFLDERGLEEFEE